MYISRIKLYNWKNFHDCEVVLSERCFIVGANATGKSNFLDVIRFMRDIVKQGGGLQAAVALRGGLKKIRCLAARQRTEVCIDLDICENGQSSPKWRYSLELSNKGGGIQKPYPLVNREIAYNYYTNKTVLDRKYSSQEEDSETLKFTHLEQPTANAEFREIKDVFQTTEYLNVIPQFVRDADSVMLSSGMEDYFGRNFMERLSLLNTATRNKYLKIINEVLLTAVPQLENLSFVKDEKGVPHIEAKYNGGLKAASRTRKCFLMEPYVLSVSCLLCWTVAALFFWKSRRRICILLSLRQYRSLLPRCSATRKGRSS